MRKGQFIARVKRVCKCGKEFHVRPKRIEQGRGEYCSQKCKYKYRVRPSGLKYVLVKENPTSFRPGHDTWNKGTVGVCKANHGSIKKGERRGVETEFKKGQIPKNWKGDMVGYNALHRWVARHRGKAKICDECGSDKFVQWANISREYKRELNDYREMCSKCHRTYDKNHLGIATKKFKLIHRKKNKKCK